MRDVKQIKLKYVATSFSSAQKQSDVYETGEYEVYGASGFVGYLNTYGADIPYIGIVKDGAGVGRANIYKPYTSLLGTMAYIIPRNSANTDIHFLKYAIDALDLGNTAGERATIPHIYFSVYGNQYILDAPISTQIVIAGFLDHKCSQVDALIANVQAQIEKLKAYKQSLITEVVIKGLDPTAPMKDSGVEWIGEIPAAWDTVRVKQLLRERKERSAEGKEEPLSMSQKVGLVPTKTLDAIPNPASSYVGAKLAFVNDLVFNKLKAHLGVFSVSKYDGLVSPDYAVYYSTGVVDLKYLEYLFKTPQCISEFSKRSTGIAAGLTRLYTDGLFAIECPLPPKDEQQAIVAYLDEKWTQIDRLIAIKQAKIEKLEQYKRSLIYEYVTGKKEVR